MDIKIVTSWIGIATGLIAIVTFFMSIRQRQKELRWKQAELARKLVDDFLNDPDAAQGLYMLDGLQYPFKDFFGRPMTVTPTEIVDSIEKSVVKENLDDKQARILFCIDSILYFMNRIESSLKSKLIVFEDVDTPCDYYVSLIAPNKVAFSRYMHEVKYTGLLQFCERFPSWTSTMP